MDMNQSHIDKGLVGLVGLGIAASVPAATVAGELGAEHTLQVGETLSVRPHLEYRPRVLTHTGRDMKANGQKASVTQRVRLGVGATLLDTVHVRVDAQDVRTWGEELSTLGDRRPDGPEIYQAYGELRLFEGSVVRVGRQEIKIDEGRLFWHRDWNDHAQSFDAVRVDQGIGQLKLTGLWSRVSEDDVYEVDANGNALRGAPGDHDVVAAHARSEHLSWLRPSAVFVYDRDGSNEAECYVVGVFVDGEVLPGLSYRTELYHQSGQRPYGAANTMGYYQRADVSAFMFSARADEHAREAGADRLLDRRDAAAHLGAARSVLPGGERGGGAGRLAQSARAARGPRLRSARGRDRAQGAARGRQGG